MKKIFYKIFFILIVIAYIPLGIIYCFNSLYINRYIENKKIKELREITEYVNIVSFSEEYKRKIESTSDIKINIINLNIDEVKTQFFNYKNKENFKINLDDLEINQSVVRFVKVSNLLNEIYIIKKVDSEKYIIISSLMVVPEVISHIILSAYFYITAFIIPIVAIFAYILSKKMSMPIELLEEVSQKMSKLDFSKTIEIKSDDELTRLGNNINSMALTMKNTIDELKKQLKNNKNLMKFEKEFVSSISHELKTPIAVINGYIEMLYDKIITDPKEIEKIYSVVYSEGLYLDEMIKDLNSYHKYGFDFFQIEKKEIRIKEYIERIMEKYQLDIKERGIELVTEIEDKIITTDSGKLSIILNNLITNAIAYVDSNKKINILFKNNILEISNSSEYISDEKLANIFKPFYKLESHRDRKYGGTGLGLSIVKNILGLLQLKYNISFDKERNFLVFNIEFYGADQK